MREMEATMKIKNDPRNCLGTSSDKLKPEAEELRLCWIGREKEIQRAMDGVKV